MKQFLLLFFSCTALITGCKSKRNHSATNETEANIYRSADSMMDAFKRKDWLTFAKYNNPAMQKMMGGQKALASFINEQMKQIPDTAIKSMDTGKILQVVKTNKDEQCVIEQNMEMHLDGMKILRTTYLIGESLDNGKSWTFFDASTDALKPQDVKPDLSPQLKIPEKKQDVQKL